MSRNFHTTIRLRGFTKTDCPKFLARSAHQNRALRHPVLCTSFHVPMIVHVFQWILLHMYMAQNIRVKILRYVYG